MQSSSRDTGYEDEKRRQREEFYLSTVRSTNQSRVDNFGARFSEEKDPDEKADYALLYLEFLWMGSDFCRYDPILLDEAKRFVSSYRGYNEAKAKRAEMTLKGIDEVLRNPEEEPIFDEDEGASQKASSSLKEAGAGLTSQSCLANPHR